jgi:streptogramin lyase
MKRSTILIVAAIAASVCLASIGVSTAMATHPPVLCKESEEQCKYSNLIPEGATIVAETEASDQVKIATYPMTIKCPGSKLEATVGGSSGNARLLSITSWTLGTWPNLCTGISTKGDCGEAKGENLPYTAEMTWPDEEIHVWEPQWHFNCKVNGGPTSYFNCTIYEELAEPYFDGGHESAFVAEYEFQHSESCGEVTQISGKWRFVSPSSTIYVAERGPAAPQVVTEAANHITATGATLAGSVNPEGAPTSYWFEYGKTTEYGTKVPASPKEVGTGFSSVAVSQSLTGLSNNTYHYRLVAENPLGKPVPGEDKTFYVGPPSFRSSFSSEASSHPAGVAVDKSGNLWIADEAKSLLQHWTRDGKLIKSIKLYGAQPTAVAVDSEGNVWVNDNLRCRLWQITPEGEFIGIVGEEGEICSEAIALDSENDLWVAGPGIGVVEYSVEGELLQTIEPEGGFNEATGIAVSPSGRVYVADYGNQQALGFNQSGQLLWKVGPIITYGEYLTEPASLASDSEGNVWVTAEGDNKVYEFTENGKYITKFGGTGTGNGKFKFARAGGIAVDSEFNIWVSDQENSRVQQWSR